jgi:hypothetical protein
VLLSAVLFAVLPAVLPHLCIYGGSCCESISWIVGNYHCRLQSLLCIAFVCMHAVTYMYILDNMINYNII